MQTANSHTPTGPFKRMDKENPKSEACPCSCKHHHPRTKKQWNNPNTALAWSENHKQFRSLIQDPHNKHELIFAFGGIVVERA